MKKIIAILAVAATSIAGGFSQGLTFMSNYVGVPNFVPIPLDGSSSGLYGPTYEAALFVAGTQGAGVTPLATVAFTAQGLGGDGYFDGGNLQVAIPGVASGSVASLVVVAWDAATMGTAPGGVYGESLPFDVTLGGGNVAPGNLGNMQSFDAMTIAVPEPSTIAMIALGLGAVVFRFRRK